MPRPDNTIQKMRLEAWRHAGFGDIWNCSWLGEDFLGLDSLCCKLYIGLKNGGEDAAVARHAFEEFYDVGLDGKFSPPGIRPPEITAKLNALYGFASNPAIISETGE